MRETEIVSAPDVARLVADVLQGADVPYAIGGAIAYGMYGPPRATNDVDVNIFVDCEDLDPALDALTAAGIEIPHEQAKNSARERGDFIGRYRGMRIDFFTPSIALSESAKNRTQTMELQGRPLEILAAEDIVLFKLLFFRGKDIQDVERLVLFQGAALDHKYIRNWLVQMVAEDDERVILWDRLADPPD